MNRCQQANFLGAPGTKRLVVKHLKFSLGNKEQTTYLNTFSPTFCHYYTMSQHHIQTRITNKDRHPRIPDMPALRWSSETVQKDTAASKAAALEAEVRKHQNIRCVAEIENELQERSVQRQVAFAKPTSKITCKPKLTRAPTVLDTTATP